MSRRRSCPLAVASISAVVVSLFGISFSAQGQNLPARMFEVKSGSIQMQGGLLGLRDEVMLFMIIGNETGKTIWAEIEFRLPETGEPLREVEKIKRRNANMFQWPVSTVIWDTEYPFTVSVYADRKRNKLLGSEQSSFFFEGDEDREVFEKLRARLPPGQATAINGFRELREPNLSAEVPGTAASSLLQRDITRRLFAESSKYHKECEHSVLKAEAYEAAKRSVIVSDMGEEGLELEQRLRAKDQMLIEKWFVKSCETVNMYEVLLVMSPESGTDIMVKKLESVK